MNVEKFDIVEVNDNKFIVVNKITYNSNVYLYLIDEAEESDDTALVKVVENEGGYEFISIEDDKEFDIVFDKLVVENKEEIKTILGSN